MNLMEKEEMVINPNVGAVWPPLMLGLREQLRGYIWFASIYNSNSKQFFKIIFFFNILKLHHFIFIFLMKKSIVNEE